MLCGIEKRPVPSLGRGSEFVEHALPSPRNLREDPAFLHDLDTHPERAFELFYTHTMRFFRGRGASLLLRIPEQDREDFVQSFVLACCENGFRVLRKYRPDYGAFDAWLTTVARNRRTDRWRRWDNRVIVDDEVVENALPPRKLDLVERIDRQRLKRAIREFLMKIPAEDRRLLLDYSEGCRPLELAKRNGLPPGANKKISDRVRYRCRQLAAWLAERKIYCLEPYSNTETFPPGRSPEGSRRESSG